MAAKARTSTVETPDPLVLIPRVHWPVRVAGHISQGFGEKQVDYSKYGLIAHNGIDITIRGLTGAEIGREGRLSLVAPVDGVVWTYYDAGYGNTVEIWTPKVGDAGVYKVILAHMYAVAVNNGREVRVGDFLGIMGSTGNSTGIHVHFGLKFLAGKNPGYRNWVDPTPFLAERPTNTVLPQ